MGRIPLWGLLLLALATVIASPSVASAAEIAPAFAERLQALSDGDYVSVFLIMRDQADISTMNQSLKTERVKLAVRHERVVSALRRAAETSQPPVLAALESERTRGGGVAGYTSHWISNLVVAKVTKACLYRLAARDDIAYIEPNFSVELITPVEMGPFLEPDAKESSETTRGIGVTPGLRAINADRVWYELGITGEGVIVANCDTGVDGTHPALASRWRGLTEPASECWLNLIGGHASFPYDGYGHGTHVMGTITGLGAGTQDTVGVAWGARWIATDPINQGVSSEFDNDIITAYEWFADPDGNPNTNDDVPDVVQNSWRINEGFGGDYTDCDTRWWAAIDNCEAAGVVTTWSAGNEGQSGSQTIGSPADRATTLTNCFSVGAVDATNYGYPWPIAYFSSLGPTGCNVPAPQKIKPEISAPGVDIYSSVPGGGYDGTYDGTSMAGPHVAGVVALMREANPNLDVDSVKEIIMATAVDLGSTGEDNTYGWGMIDAYAAVVAATTGFGQLQGIVRNTSNGGTPIPGVAVEAVEADRSANTGADGRYAMSVAPGLYTVQATHVSFAPQSVHGVSVIADQTTNINFNLVDIGAPVIANTTDLRSTSDTVGPYAIQSTITDFSNLVSTRLHYRVNGGAFQTVALTAGANNVYSGSIPGQAYTSHVEYYVSAADVVANVATDPANAPSQLYGFYVAPIVAVLSENVEGGSPGWTHAVVNPGFVDQWHISTQRNHTAGGTSSWKCGDTGAADYANLLDAGLVTPVVPLGLDSSLRFWHWIEAETSSAYPGYAYDGGIIEISLGGGPWQQLTPDGGYDYIVRTGGTPGPFTAGTPFFSGSHDWQLVTVDLGAYEGTAQIRFRFGSDGATVREGWFIDDVVIDGFQIEMSSVPVSPARPAVDFRPADPNPFRGETHLRYELRAAGDVRLQVFDPAGRLVRTLVNTAQQAGVHESVWDGRNDAAQTVAPGIYFSRLQAGGQVISRKVILTQ